MPTYFISNDTSDNNRPSSTYCFEPGQLGRGRYKGRDDSATGHNWWLYCCPTGVADDLLDYWNTDTKFEVTQGNLGGNITIRRVGHTDTYDLVVPPVVGNDTVELVPAPNNQFEIGHVGHTIQNDNAFRARTAAPILTLDQEKASALTAYNNR